MWFRKKETKKETYVSLSNKDPLANYEEDFNLPPQPLGEIYEDLVKSPELGYIFKKYKMDLRDREDIIEKICNIVSGRIHTK